MATTAPETELLPPSAAAPLVYLRAHGETSTSELNREIPLSPRTLRHGLRKLHDVGLVEKCEDPDDRRSSLYRVTEA